MSLQLSFKSQANRTKHTGTLKPIQEWHGSGGMALSVKRLPCKHENLNSIPITRGISALHHDTPYY